MITPTEREKGRIEQAQAELRMSQGAVIQAQARFVSARDGLVTLVNGILQSHGEAVGENETWNITPDFDLVKVEAPDNGTVSEVPPKGITVKR